MTSLADLAKKPELIKLTIDDPDIVTKYGSEVTFWTYDRCPLELFTKLAGVDQSNPSEMIQVVKHLMLDENSHEILSKDKMLPPALLIRAIQKIVGVLGN